MSQEIIKTESTAIATTAASKGDLIAFARSPEELQQNQEGLTAWAMNKLTEARQHHHHMIENLNQAKVFGWGVKGFQSAVLLARKQMEFYEKIHAAFQAGFYVVPDFPIDVFAVRTTRDAPEPLENTNTSSWGDSVNRSQQGTGLPLGVGDYVSDEPEVLCKTIQGKDKEGNAITGYKRWAESFQDVDFPIKTASVMVLDATGKAIALKLFDEIGILPERTKKKTDPMVIGRVKYRHNKVERTVSFVIAWFLREADLTI